MIKWRFPVALGLIGFTLGLVGIRACSRGHDQFLRRPSAALGGWLCLRCPDKVRALAFSADGKSLAAGMGIGSGTGVITIWDLDHPRSPIALGDPTEKLIGSSYITSLAFAADGKGLVAGSARGIKLWDIATGLGRIVDDEESSRFRYFHSALNPELRLVATATATIGKPNLRLRNWETGRELSLDPPPSDAILQTFSPDGKFLAVRAAVHSVHIYATSTGAKLRTLPVNCEMTTALAFAPDGRTLATGHPFLGVQLWDLSTERVRAVCSGHGGQVVCLAFSPDGELVASGSDNGEVKLWHSATGVEVAGHHEHEDAVNAVVFSPDGHYLASGSSDKTIRLWSCSRSNSR